MNKVDLKVANNILMGIFKGPSYSPPYDSPSENKFAYNLVKYLEKDVELHPQYSIKTHKTTFHLD